MSHTVVAIPAFADNYIWLLINQQMKQAVCVDPGDAEPVLAYLQHAGLALTEILITHHHRDHTGGVEALLKVIDVPVYGPDNPYIAGISTIVREGDSITLKSINATFTVMEIPGHTLDHIAYYNNVAGELYCGDTLFAGGCGRVFEGSFRQMYASLSRFLDLPDNTDVYCAHEYTLQNLRFALQVEPDNAALNSRISAVARQRAAKVLTLPSNMAIERQTNPFLRCAVPAVKASAQKRTADSLLDDAAVFRVIRQWKDDC